MDFNELPEISKSRFVAATRTPVASFVSSAASSGAWGCLLIPALLVLGPLLLTSVTAGASFKGDVVGPMIAAFAFFTVLGGLGIARASAMRSAHPYVLGTYLFPTQIVIAESRVLAVYPLLELINVGIVNRYVNGGYQQSTITCTFKTGPAAVLTVRSIQEAHRVRDALSQGQQVLIDAYAKRDYEPLRALDPLFEAQMTSFAKVSEPGPSVRALPKWTEAGPRFLISLGTSLVVTGLVFLVRAIVASASPDPTPTATRKPPVTPTATTPPATPAPTATQKTPAPAPTTKKKTGR
ncbi:Hypothetical protein A7982_08036 [Minicystis rosea]|nr:Hypothetical protein A7982_08036 [Minicystis rosea]